MATEPRAVVVQTSFAWSVEDAQGFDDFSLVWFPNGVAGTGLDWILRKWDPTLDDRAGDNVQIQYSGPSAPRIVSLLISPICRGPTRAGADAIEGFGALAKRDGRAAVSIWTGDVHIAVRGLRPVDADIPGILAALRPLNAVAATKLAGWPAPSEC